MLLGAPQQFPCTRTICKVNCYTLSFADRNTTKDTVKSQIYSMPEGGLRYRHHHAAGFGSADPEIPDLLLSDFSFLLPGDQTDTKGRVSVEPKVH